MEIRELLTFLTIAKLKSFSQAAAQEGYTQAAVTLQIKRLEADLNVSLFNRIGNKISLSEQGERFYPQALAIINSCKEAKDTMNSAASIEGDLTIGTIESICSGLFPSLLGKFHTLYPGVNANIITGSPQELLNSLNNNHMDFVYFMDEKRYDANWVRVLEIPEEIVFVTGADAPLPKNRSFTLKELVQWPFILTEKDASYRYLLDQRLASQGLSLTPFLESQNTSFLLDFLHNNFALTFLPKFTVAEAVKKKRLRILPVKDFQLAIWRQVVYHKSHYLSKPMQAFFDLLKEKG